MGKQHYLTPEFKAKIQANESLRSLTQTSRNKKRNKIAQKNNQIFELFNSIIKSNINQPKSKKRTYMYNTYKYQNSKTIYTGMKN